MSKKLSHIILMIIVFSVVAVTATVEYFHQSPLFNKNDDSSTVSDEADGTSGGFSIRFIDVGQADAALISCDDKHMLIDGGNRGDSDTIVSVLRQEEIEYLDYVICTHAHEDHVGGLSGALSNFPVGNVYCSVDSYDSDTFDNFVKYTKQQGLSITIPDVGDVISLGSAKAVFLGPLHEYDETNNMSLILKIFYKDTSFLFMGDCELTAENDMIESNIDLSCDLIKIGHHGSSTSSGYRLIYEAQPKYAVISVGKDNSYGHPHEEVLSRLEDAEITVYRTDIRGDITVHSDGSELSFEFQKGSPEAKDSVDETETKTETKNENEMPTAA